MVNAATAAKAGGQGKSPWTRINGTENEPNRVYGQGEAPAWLPNRKGPPGEEVAAFVKEMAART